jgi:hypothetical protein
MWGGSDDAASRKALLIEAPQSDPQTVPPDHSGLAAKRVVVGVLGGIVIAGIALAEGASWSVAALGATDVAALVFVAWVWISVAGVRVRDRHRCDHGQLGRVPARPIAVALTRLPEPT